ncbi:MAG: hypothetical protein IJ613_11365 [Muribaculaceae bacterium]|nr:hypothetical protein [Muribaculaceae bacterium]
MNAKRLLTGVMLFVATFLFAATTWAQTPEIQEIIAGIEGVYTMTWDGALDGDGWDEMGAAGSIDAVEIRGIPGTDSVTIKNFYMEGITVKAGFKSTSMLSIPRQKVSDELLTSYDNSCKFDAIGGANYFDYDLWRYRATQDLDDGLIDSDNGQIKFARGLSWMVICQYADKGMETPTRAYQNVKLTYQSPLPSVEPVRGDVNGDGIVDVGDVNLVINIMLGKE